uniref:Uncharacterized protein n=1 Tax=Opuntia streptacantha TaxID=393608 RepID=A0A7C8ZVL6_OPUST
MEKNIINPAEIWTTRLLPIRVSVKRPAFSTETEDPVTVPNIPDNKIAIPCQPTPRLRTEGGIIVALAARETAMKAPVDSTRATKEANIIAKASPASNVGAPH